MPPEIVLWKNTGKLLNNTNLSQEKGESRDSLGRTSLFGGSMPA
jgi:hypothetical protein